LDPRARLCGSEGPAVVCLSRPRTRGGTMIGSAVPVDQWEELPTYSPVLPSYCSLHHPLRPLHQVDFFLAEALCLSSPGPSSYFDNSGHCCLFESLLRSKSSLSRC
jgi:hypothetical protein